MSKLYLVTGFLGAGKTTFLKNLIGQLRGQKILLIVNEFGKEGVDGKILKDLGAALCEISGGSVFCACRSDRLYYELKKADEEDFDVIIVEASGLSDPSGCRKIIEQGHFSDIELKGALVIADAARLKKYLATSVTALNQIKAGSLIVLNKCDIASEEQKKESLSLIRSIRPDAEVLMTEYGKVDKEKIEGAMSFPFKEEPVNSLADITAAKKTVYFKQKITLAALKKFLDKVSPLTYRIKGFCGADGRVYLIDCVQDIKKVEPFKGYFGEYFADITYRAGEPLLKAIREADKECGDILKQNEELFFGGNQRGKK